MAPMTNQSASALPMKSWMKCYRDDSPGSAPYDCSRNPGCEGLRRQQFHSSIGHDGTWIAGNNCRIPSGRQTAVILFTIAFAGSPERNSPTGISTAPFQFRHGAPAYRARGDAAVARVE